MTLTPGSRVGPYIILAPLGAGGMGEVYRATDTRLDRPVAVKVLSSRLAGDPDAMARFEREAKAIAALSHPNILGIHELCTYDGVTVAATELLEGETLRARIEFGGGAIPVRKALEYALQMAQGLAAAHGRGIIHRDLKPENLFITRDGRLKILDFGLAKLTTPAHAQAGSLLTTPAETNPGTVLGTAGYMSPEQVRGEPVDARSDIFAFGAVLYEMLTGRRAFSRDTTVETMAAILKEDPPDPSGSALMLPSSLERVVRRCLEKRADERFHSAHDLGLAIEALAGASTTSREAAVATTPSKRLIGWPERAAWLALAVVVVAAAVWLRPGPMPARTVSRFGIPAPPGMGFYSEYGLLAISPNGRQVAFVASGADGVSRLWLRPLDSLTSRPLPGTDGGVGPFWSPDGQQLAFFANGKLMKTAIAGGEPQTLCAVGEPGGGTWSRDGVILLVPHFEGPLKRVSAGGGDIQNETTLDPAHKESNHLWPYFLPDGKHYLFLVFGADNTGIYMGTLGSAERKTLVTGGDLNVFAAPVYAPSGHLLYIRGGTLMALPFDADRQEVRGAPIRVTELVEQANAGAPTYAATTDEVLVYSTGPMQQPTQVAWVDRTGRETALVGAPGTYRHRDPLSLSPDDRRAAMMQQDGSALNVWTVDLARGAFTKLTFDQFATRPVWSPDGLRLSYAVARDTPPNLYIKDADGAAPDTRVFRSEIQMYPTAWTTDGSALIYHVVEATTGWDIWRVGIDGASPTALLNTRFNEREARLSRDGKWLAYQSDESGRYEVYVVPAAVSGRKWQISTSGGTLPVWRKDGRELLYRDAQGVLQSMSITTADGVFEPAVAKPLFKLPGDAFDVTADGQKILIIRTAGDPVSPPLTVVMNWTAGLGQPSSR